jgi:hypothetical protein
VRVSARSNRPDIIPDPVIDYVSPNNFGSLTFTPASNATGTVSITITVDDSQPTNSTFTRAFSVTVRPLEDAPTIGDIPDPTMSEDTSISVPFIVADPDHSAVATGLTITATSSDQQLLPNGNIVAGSAITNGLIRSLTLTPASNQFGVVTITVMVTDEGTLTATDTFLLTITPANDPPTLNTLSDLNLDENASEQLIPLSGIGPGATNESEAVTLTASSSNPILVPDPVIGYTTPASTGTLRLRPAAGQTGSAVITVLANDGQASNSVTSRSFTVNVRHVNRPPTIEPLANVVTAEDVPVTVPFVIGDPDGLATVLSVTASSSNQTLVANSNIVLTGIGAQRTATIIPSRDRFGFSMITLTVSDGTAATNALFGLTVGEANDPPTIDPIPSVSVAEGRGLFQVGFTGVSSGASNESQNVSITATSSIPSLLAVQSVNYNGMDNGTVRLRTAASGAGEATVTVTVDDHGASNNLITRTFTVLVTAAGNTPPAISEILPQSTPEDTPLGSILFNISDAQTPASELLVTATSSDSHLVPPGNIAIDGAAGDRTLTITPAQNAFGSATITIVVRDSGFAQATATIPFTVTAVNDPPALADPPDVTLIEDAAPVEIPLQLSDVDNGPDAITVTATNLPLAEVQVLGVGTNRALRITPLRDQAGTGTISVAARDGSASTTREILLTITPENDRPTILLPPSHVIAEDTEATIPISISDVDTPFERLILLVTSSNQALVPDANINISGGSNTVLNITPISNQFGQTIIMVQAADDLGAGATASFVLTVQPVNDPPALDIVSNLTIAANGPPVSRILTGVHVGPVNEGQSAAIVAISGNLAVLPHPAVDLSLLSASNAAVLQLVPVPGTRGTAPVSVTISDGQSQTTRSFDVTVDGPPTIARIPDQFTDTETALPPVRVLIGDPESGPGPLTLSASVSNPALFATTNFVFSGSGSNRTVTLPAAPLQVGASFVTIIVTDPVGNSASNAFLFTISPKPPAIERQPLSQTVAEGAAVTLQVVATGQPLSYQWQRNGSDLPGQTNATLAFASATLADSAQYRVIVSNPTGTITSEAATLRVLPVPQIISLTAGAQTITITIATVPTYTYALQFSDTLAPTNWSSLATFTATASEVTVEDVASTKGFYRIRVLP